MLAVDIKTVIITFCYEVPVNRIHTHTLNLQQYLSENQTAVVLLKHIYFIIAILYTLHSSHDNTAYASAHIHHLQIDAQYNTNFKHPGVWERKGFLAIY